MPSNMKPIKAVDRAHLSELTQRSIRLFGPRVDLSFIDVSDVDDFSCLFDCSPFDGRLDGWNTSRAVTMRSMFSRSRFTGDISRWNTGKVQDMSSMFMACPFNGDVSAWNTSNVQNMAWMFAFSQKEAGLDGWSVGRVTNMVGMFERSFFKGNVARWDVSKVRHMSNMFERSPFSGDVADWNVSNVVRMNSMFKGSPFKGDLSRWDVQESVLAYPVVDVTRLVQMLKPSVFHWANLLSNPKGRLLQRRTEWTSHRDEFVNIAQGLGLRIPAAARFLQEQWRGKNPNSTPTDMLVLPEMFLEA